MPNPYHEIVTYTVSDPATADAARAEAERRLRAYPGFLSWTHFRGAETANDRCDVIAWASMDAARTAADAVAAAPDFAAFRASIRNVSSMGHYCAAAPQPLADVPGTGVEIGRFRLKPGVSEDAARTAYLAMVRDHLAPQTGWQRQMLVALDDGVFVDLAFATTRTQAEALCASWAGAPACDAFLALIEPDGMSFGSVLAGVSAPTP